VLGLIRTWLKCLPVLIEQQPAKDDHFLQDHEVEAGSPLKVLEAESMSSDNENFKLANWAIVSDRLLTQGYICKEGRIQFRILIRDFLQLSKIQRPRDSRARYTNPLDYSSQFTDGAADSQISDSSSMPPTTRTGLFALGSSIVSPSIPPTTKTLCIGLTSA
jgi:hypothetical protein